MSEQLSDGEIVDGKKDGYWITYYANGNKRSEGAYKAGIKHGKWITYHQNANKKTEGTFRNGEYEGHYASYHKNGATFREGEYGKHQGNSYDGRKEGVWYQYEADGETISAKVTYKHGRVVDRVSERPF